MTVQMLSRHTRLATSDLDQARAEVGRSFCPHELSLTERGGRLSMVHNAADVGGISVHYLRYGDEVRITPGRFEDFYLMQVPLKGQARVKVGDRVVASNRGYASLPSPSLPVDMIWSADCEQLLVHLPRRAVEAAAGAPDGTTDVVFDPLVDLGSPAIRSWLRLVHLACDEAELGRGVLSSPLAASHFEQVIVSGLLAAQPNSSTLAPARADSAPVSRTVRAALVLIEECPERPWRVADLAGEVGVSPRTLQEAFQRERGTTPLEELRRTRLARAHADLLDGSPESTTVTEVAARWGFFHLGRFSQTYRAAHGQAPSTTLAS